MLSDFRPVSHRKGGITPLDAGTPQRSLELSLGLLLTVEREAGQRVDKNSYGFVESSPSKGWAWRELSDVELRGVDSH